MTERGDVRLTSCMARLTSLHTFKFVEKGMEMNNDFGLIKGMFTVAIVYLAIAAFYLMTKVAAWL